MGIDKPGPEDERAPAVVMTTEQSKAFQEKHGLVKKEHVAGGEDKAGVFGEADLKAAKEYAARMKEKPVLPGFSPEAAKLMQAEAARQIVEQKARIDQMTEPEEPSDTIAQPSERDIPTQVIKRPEALKSAPKKSLWSRIFGK